VTGTQGTVGEPDDGNIFGSFEKISDGIVLGAGGHVRLL
jgi:hypothetical protein